MTKEQTARLHKLRKLVESNKSIPPEIKSAIIFELKVLAPWAFNINLEFIKP